MEERVCPLCKGRLISVEEELVCQSCGYVAEDVNVVPSSSGNGAFYELGSRMGARGLSGNGKFSGIGESSSIKYYSMLSEYWLKSSRECEEHYCMKIISRVCEKLAIPENVALYAFQLSREMLPKRENFKDLSVPTICLYSLIVSCKKSGMDRVNVRKIFRTFRVMGYRVSLAALAKVSCLANTAMKPKPAEEYLTTIIPAIASHPIILERVGKHYLSQVEYERRLYRTTLAVLAYVDRLKRGGHNPYALAATAAYAGEVALSKIEKRRPLFSQRIVSECVDVAEYTVREQYSELFREAVQTLLLKTKL